MEMMLDGSHRERRKAGAWFWQLCAKAKGFEWYSRPSNVYCSAVVTIRNPKPLIAES